MKVFLWHVHGSYTTALVQGDHEYLVPVTKERGREGLGRAATWSWPDSVREVTKEQAAEIDVDVVILQRPEELVSWCEEWLGGRRPGHELPAVYLEHTSPQGQVNEMRHPAADRPDLVMVHVTHFNDLFWDAGETPTVVVEHGVVDPGHRYTGELERSAAVINEPVRRKRVTGTDLLPRFAQAGPVDLFGMGAEALGGTELIQEELHAELGRRRVYLHPFRWTSLGLTLLEAMHLGMPVVALATTEIVRAVPPGTGFVSTHVDELVEHIRRLLGDPEESLRIGKAARDHALENYGLDRFLGDWDRVLEAVVTR